MGARVEAEMDALRQLLNSTCNYQASRASKQRMSRVEALPKTIALPGKQWNAIALPLCATHTLAANASLASLRAAAQSRRASSYVQVYQSKIV